MQFRGLLASLLGTVLLANANAQFPGSGSGNLRVRVLFADSDHPAPKQSLVQLMAGSSSTPVATNYTGETGWVEFAHLQVGDYHVLVSGDGIQRTESDMFEVDSRKMTQTQYVYVHSDKEGTSTSDSRGGPMVSAADLNLPSGASKEFKKGNDAMAREEWKNAADHFHRALEIYPKYAPALTNLAVVYSHLNDPAGEREALDKAIVANDHYAPAYLNLAVLCMKQSAFTEAEYLLLKAVPLDPTSARTFLFLANVQLLNRQFDAAIASAQRVHELPHQNLALAHFIAARAYEHENRPQDALAELQLFLKEEPQGPRADHVREELKYVQRHSQ
jgi:tetratricopeptide (TPR) repeat protein